MTNNLSEVDESIAGEGFELVEIDRATGKIKAPPASVLGHGAQVPASEFYRQMLQMERSIGEK